MRVAGTTPSTDEQVFAREGEYWSVAYDGRTVRLRDLKGMRYLARLLAEPGREFHAVDLVATESGESATDVVAASRLTTGPLLDAKAKDAYRRRLDEIRDDIEDARSRGDVSRAEQAEAEREFLSREIARAVGVGGRDRRTGSASERARVSVTRALRQAIARVQEQHPRLAEHLQRAIRTGTYCAYLPDRRASQHWKM